MRYGWTFATILDMPLDQITLAWREGKETKYEFDTHEKLERFMSGRRGRAQRVLQGLLGV